MDEKELFLDELDSFESTEKRSTKKTDKSVGIKASALNFFRNQNGQNGEEDVQIQEGVTNEHHFVPSWHKVNDANLIDGVQMSTGQEITDFLDDSPVDRQKEIKGRNVQALSINRRIETNNESQGHFVSHQNNVENRGLEDKANAIFTNETRTVSPKNSEFISDKEVQSAIISVRQKENEHSQENFVTSWHKVENVDTSTIQEGSSDTVAPSLFVDETENVFGQNDIIDAFDDESQILDDPYIYFDFDKDDVKKINHDKMALRQVHTEAGGGATFQASYTKKGKLVSELSLDEKQAVPFIRLGELERDMQLLQDVKSDEDTSDVSRADSLIEAAVYYSIDKADALRSQYKEIRKDASKEIKQLKKEIKEEEQLKRRQEAEVKKYFPESAVEFREDSNGFSNVIDTNFKNESEYIESYFSDEIHKDRLARDEVSQNETFQNENSEKEDFEENKLQSQSPLNEKEEPREMSKEEKLEQAKSKKKAARKSENSAVVKMARRTAVGIFIKTKKAAQDEAENMNFQSSGDAIKDGKSGLLQSALDVIKQAISKAALMTTASIGKFLAGLLGPAFLVVIGVLLAGVMLINVIGSVAITIASFQSDGGIEYDLDVEGDGMAYAYLSSEQIEAIIASLYVTYPDMSYTQETVLRYSLSKVGCAYDQDYHSSLTVDIFDCSSLAYRSYLQVGIDIAYQNLYTAAYECYALEQQGKIVGDLQPGDLIFYGGSANNRYLGIYHVAIYVGKIDGVDKMVEARGEDYGVLYCDVRTSNVVRIARPY